MYKKYRRNIDKITFRTLARQVRMRIDEYRKEREESVLRSASIKKFYSYGPRLLRNFILTLEVA